MRYISTGELKKGDKIAKNIFDKNGALLLCNGATISGEGVVKRLLNNGIYGVYINDEWSADIFVESTVDDVTINKTMRALEDYDIDTVVECAFDIVDKLCTSSDLMNDVACIKDYDNDTHMHCINVAIASVTLGIGLGYNYERLKNLSAGALLHDIGKVKIPIEILNKQGKLTDDEMDIMNRHPEYGYNIVRKNISTSSPTREIVHQHHENWDGTGYPRGLAGAKIYQPASVVHV